jgi:pSer/pThr/pTyr-binding forkhead associated (FHA) protein
VINCAKCGKENQDHYKFCLGCGAELAKSAAPKPFNPNTPPHGNPAVRPSSIPRPGGTSSVPSATAQKAASTSQATERAAPIGATPAAATATALNDSALSDNPANDSQIDGSPAADGAVGLVECPQCGHRNKPGNRFCASCGFNVAATSSPPQQAKSGANIAAANVGSAAPGVTVTLTALRADGTEAGSFALPSAPVTLLGRDTGSIFAGDSYLSPRHASILISGNQVTVRDEGSLNGVYLRLRPQSPWQLKFGDMFRIGQEIIKLEALEGQTPGPDGVVRLGSPREGYVGRLALVIGRDTTGNAFPIPRGGVHCGRERGDILFSDDGYVSGLHCRIAPEDNGQIYLTDVGSSNGTFVRLSRDHALSQSDILLMGQQLFRVDIR